MSTISLQVIVVQQSPQAIPNSHTCLSCLVFWFCSCLFGGFAFVYSGEYSQLRFRIHFLWSSVFQKISHWQWRIWRRPKYLYFQGIYFWKIWQIFGLALPLRGWVYYYQRGILDTSRASHITKALCHRSRRWVGIGQTMESMVSGDTGRGRLIRSHSSARFSFKLSGNSN